MSFPNAAGFHCASSPLRVLELFAGVGGFRYGLEQANRQLFEEGLARGFDTVWANQWEPGCRRQAAAVVYEKRWGEAPVNRNLFELLDDANEMQRIADLSPTMLVGGFPCQDYSVAKPASQSAGIEGKKGVLWWGIHKLLTARSDAGQPVQVVLLENVDRLLGSPSKCRGRDFAIILASLQSLGYAIAWQVVSAADYGFPQRRKRVFMVAVHRSSPQFGTWRGAARGPADWLTATSPLARALPVDLAGLVREFKLGADVHAAQEAYRPLPNGATPFASAGVCIEGVVFTAASRALPIADFTPFVGCSSAKVLGDIVAGTESVPAEFYLDDARLEQWRRLKGAKRVERVTAQGHAYTYAEGAVAFPDSLDRPARTIITSEGGSGASRTKHVVATADGRLRRLTPDELDALNGFPRGFTDVDGVTPTQRAFLMGNALVTGVVARLGWAIASRA
jgi:DNA (cytosine-5)-methyltransferase 1